MPMEHRLDMRRLAMATGDWRLHHGKNRVVVVWRTGWMAATILMCLWHLGDSFSDVWEIPVYIEYASRSQNTQYQIAPEFGVIVRYGKHGILKLG